MAARRPRADDRHDWPGRRCCGGARIRRNTEIERESAEQDCARQRRLENDAAARDDRRKARADADGDREDREIDGDGILIAADCVLISGGSNDSTTMPTSQNQLVTIAPHHSRASARR